jgi:enoyl-CoA hydratase/carnithine racemase
MCTSPSVQRLSISRDGHIARVTLDRPEVRNAFDDATILELTSIFRELDTDDNVRVVVLAEGKTFCARADLNRMNRMKRMAEYSVEKNQADALKLAKMLNAVYTLHKVVSPADLDSKVDVIARGIVNNGPNAVREFKRLGLDFLDREINDDLISETAERIPRIRASEEGREGVRSFLEKRKPAWLV